MINEGSEPQDIIDVSFFFSLFIQETSGNICDYGCDFIRLIYLQGRMQMPSVFFLKVLGPKPDLPAASSDDVTADRKNTNLASLYLVNTCKYSAFKTNSWK